MEVAEATARREAYHAKNDNIAELVIKMKADGYSVEEMVRAAYAQRNLNRLSDYINDPEGLACAKNRWVQIQEYDADHFVVLLKRNPVNLFMDFGLCGFENKMEYWDMPTKLIEFKGEKGFYFGKWGGIIYR